MCDALLAKAVEDIVVIRSHMNATHITRIDSLAVDFVRPSGLRLILQLFNR